MPLSTQERCSTAAHGSSASAPKPGSAGCSGGGKTKGASTARGWAVRAGSGSGEASITIGPSASEVPPPEPLA
eukprot:10486250-Alexandrium_andersonii.AAC.1